MKRTYRIEQYRPRSDGVYARVATTYTPLPSPKHIEGFLRHFHVVGAFALVIQIEGGEEMAIERWRVAPDGQILRARMVELEPELSQPPPGEP